MNTDSDSGDRKRLEIVIDLNTVTEDDSPAERPTEDSDPGHKGVPAPDQKSG